MTEHLYWYLCLLEGKGLLSLLSIRLSLLCWVPYHNAWKLFVSEQIFFSNCPVCHINDKSYFAFYSSFLEKKFFAYSKTCNYDLFSEVIAVSASTSNWLAATSIVAVCQFNVNFQLLAQVLVSETISIRWFCSQPEYLILQKGFHDVKTENASIKVVV